MKKQSRKKKVVVVSGGFDPIHVGHLRLFQEARKLGDRLVVILNNDNWLNKKKKQIFMPQDERREVLRAISCVDEVVLTRHKPDPKDMGVSGELRRLRPAIFANGGDRNVNNIPEAATCDAIGCEMVFGIGRGGKVQSSSWLLTNYVRSLSVSRSLDVENTVAVIEKKLKRSKTPVSLKYKLMLARVILNLMNRRKGFGLFVILGWQNAWQGFIDIPDSGQDIYTRHHVHLEDLAKESKRYRIESTEDFDGAILIDKNGQILHSGIIIEGLRPRVIADKIRPGTFKDLSEQFGFTTKVHARHLSAITASYIFKGTTVFTVSEENDSLHIFEKGKIAYQTT